MTDWIQTNKQFLTDLFTGRADRHGLFIPAPRTRCPLGDFTISDRPFGEFVDYYEQYYLRVRAWHEELGDDGVPYVPLATNTGVFAACFGCELHEYSEDTNAAALPAVLTAEEADALEVPTLDAEPVRRVLAMADALQERLDEDAVIAVCDIQSPFDIAAQIWNKEAFFIAMIDTPEAVLRLVDKCEQFLTAFLESFRDRLKNPNLAHCPTAWAPPELGCWMSEDEIGSIRQEDFRTFSVPTLKRMSERFGGIFIHCCAAADHQYPVLAELPNLRGLNRVFQESGPVPAIETFSGRTVFMQAWLNEEQVKRFLDLARPDTRYLFNPMAETMEDAKGLLERLGPLMG